MNSFLSGIISFDITDHLPSFLKFCSKTLSNPNSKFKIVSRPYNEQNFEGLKSELASFNWDTEMDKCLNANKAYNSFFSKINNLYSKYFPVKIKYISYKRITTPWFTPVLKKLIKRKSEYLKMYNQGLISKDVNN